MSVARVFPMAGVTRLAIGIAIASIAYERERAAGATLAMALTLMPAHTAARVSLVVSGECEAPRVCRTADPRKHDRIFRGRGPCRGSLRPRSPACRLAGRSGHLIADGAGAAQNRPLGERAAVSRRSSVSGRRLWGAHRSAIASS